MGLSTVSVCTVGKIDDAEKIGHFSRDDLAHPFRDRDRKTYFKTKRHAHLTICIAMNLRRLRLFYSQFCRNPFPPAVIREKKPREYAFQDDPAR